VLIFRELHRDEIKCVWEIDRHEVIDGVYYFKNGGLVLRPEHWDVAGWPPGEPEKYTPTLLDCFDRGGWFYGLFDADRPVGIAILESKIIGKEMDTLQLKFLHVSADYRGQGLGRRLFELARSEARKRGAKKMYVSATPSEHTINFYLSLGCTLAPEPDPELYAFEPEDIHLECDV
jgi:predicted N-acetyltransferase YhbS